MVYWTDRMSRQLSGVVAWPWCRRTARGHRQRSGSRRSHGTDFAPDRFLYFFGCALVVVGVVMREGCRFSSFCFIAIPIPFREMRRGVCGGLIMFLAMVSHFRLTPKLGQ